MTPNPDTASATEQSRVEVVQPSPPAPAPATPATPAPPPAEDVITFDQFVAEGDTFRVVLAAAMRERDPAIADLHLTEAAWLKRLEQEASTSTDPQPATDGAISES